MSLTLVLADLEHQIDGLLILGGQCQRVLVTDKAPIVGQLTDSLQHGGGELLIIIETALDQLKKEELVEI